MSLTDVQQINLGLSKIAANRIARIDPAQTQLEAYMASNYPSWKRSELSRRTWVFALEENYKLTLSDTIPDVDKPYKYALPIDCLRPIRSSRTEWRQAGRFLYSAFDVLIIDYVRNVPEAEFDPLFNNVMACRIAYESAEYVTQSTSKKQTALAEYEDAVSEAGKVNAFIKGPQRVAEDDDSFSWLNARHGYPGQG